MESTVLHDGKTLNHHALKDCNGGPCPLHRPTNHNLIGYPLSWSSKWGVMVRIINGVEVPDPDDMNVRRGGYVLQNSFHCTRCGADVYSWYRHDFASCKCGNFTDGGHAYIRRGGNLDDMLDTSIVLPDND